MLTALEFMLAPLIACLLLISITVYFGIHVLKREIIFIDIALAQIAALGSAVTLILHELDIGSHDHVYEHDSKSLMAYIFCILAAGLFTMLKNKNIRIPLEAIIGIAYAVAATGVVIILDKGAGGDVHVHDMLTGSILWVSWSQILRLAIVVLTIGGLHYIFRSKFKDLTNHYANNQSQLNHPKIWDFLFYFTFGIVVVEAVSIGGILTVFAFLIIPASISVLFTTRWSFRILIGLIIGTIATILGLYFSWTMDLSSSPLIILFMGILLGLALILKVLKNLKSSTKNKNLL